MAQQAARQVETQSQREDRLLHQSFLDDVELQVLPYGMYAMRSSRTPADTWYFTGAQTCNCMWAINHTSPCKHQLRARLEDEFRAGPAGPATDVLVAERTLSPVAALGGIMRSRTHMINDYVMAAWFTSRDEALAKADEQWAQWGWDNRGDDTYGGKPAIRLTHGRGGSTQTEYLVIAPVDEWPAYVRAAA